MSNLWKSVFGLWLVGVGLGVSTPTQATSAVGPYYATPSWDQTLPAVTRFIVLANMNSEAVLDRETGLVWEQSPSTLKTNWAGASIHCVFMSKGGRQGWRLPTVQDLDSLIDPTQSNPALPPGHPFGNVSSFEYWSATTFAGFTSSAYAVAVFDGVTILTDKSSGGLLAWCVRGGQGVDFQ